MRVKFTNFDASGDMTETRMVECVSIKGHMSLMGCVVLSARDGFAGTVYVTAPGIDGRL